MKFHFQLKLYIMPRQNTSIESIGAEHLAMGLLMREGIQTYLADQRQEGYDLICVNPLLRRTVLVQVKSRWATNNDRSFPLKNTSSDFIVVVFLNCGYTYNREAGKREPEFYIVPTNICLQYRNPNGWRKVMTRSIPNFEIYKNNWQLIKDFIGL